jgi:molybdopterin synthase sulfur carrier subunit
VVRLVFLGRFREIGKGGEIALPAEIRTLSALTEWLKATQPGLAQALADARAQIAINQTIMRDPSHRIADGDEIAFLPPMSGG